MPDCRSLVLAKWVALRGAYIHTSFTLLDAIFPTDGHRWWYHRTHHDGDKEYRQSRTLNILCHLF
jgi:hypothetical protein